MLSKTNILSIVLIILGLLSAVLVNGINNSEVVVPGYSVGYDLAIYGEYAFVSNNDDAAVIDISNPGSPIRMNQIQLDGAFGLKIVNDTLYVGSPNDGLVLIDITTPSNPVILETHPLVNNVYDLLVAGNFVYAVSTPSQMWLWVILISLLSVGMVIFFIPCLRKRISN